VLDDQDGDTALPDFLDQINGLVQFRGVKAGCGFVERSRSGFVANTAISSLFALRGRLKGLVFGVQ
jgi:hypothetical protein